MLSSYIYLCTICVYAEFQKRWIVNGTQCVFLLALVFWYFKLEYFSDFLTVVY